MKWSDFKVRSNEFVIPLHDRQWVKDTILQEYVKDNNLNLNDPDDIEQYNRVAEGTFEIILGKPSDESMGGYIDIMFGLKSEDYLDDESLIEYITQKFWKEIQDNSLIDLRLMESFIGIIDMDLDIFSDIKGTKLVGEFSKFISDVIAESLFNDQLPDAKSTADCKRFIESTYGRKTKRTKKEKWNKIQYRTFEDEDGEVITIVSYEDKIISHYPFPCRED